MKNTLFLLFFFIFSNNTFCQTNIEKAKSIAIIENIVYNEVYFDTKTYEKTVITYHELEGRIEFTETNYASDNINYLYKTSFYLSDLDLTSLVYDLYELKPGLYIVTLQVKAKGKVVEKNITTVDKRKSPYPTSENEYLNKFDFRPTKLVSESIAIKLVENFKILIGAKNYTKKTF
jgi:hypothetical protein